MSSWTAEIRRREAEQRRDERAARLRRKDLERLIREGEKLSALEQARVEVEAHENALEILLAVHKEPDRASIGRALLPRFRHMHRCGAASTSLSPALKTGIAAIGNQALANIAAIDGARDIDNWEQQGKREDHARKLADHERMRSLARRVLSGSAQAYHEAIAEFSLTDVAGLGTSFHVTVHSPKIVECALTVNGRESVPTEMKTLTATGKLSVKAMPKQRFHEIFQDYVSGCVLRLARELLALLPVETVLVTASVKETDMRFGHAVPLPVLSVAILRSIVERFDFEKLNPSDSMENFVFWGNAVASRKSGDFIPIVPLTLLDLTPASPERVSFTSLLPNLRKLRIEIRSMLTSEVAANIAF